MRVGDVADTMLQTTWRPGGGVACAACAAWRLTTRIVNPFEACPSFCNEASLSFLAFWAGWQS